MRLGAELFDADRPTPFERFFFREPNGYVFDIVEAEQRPGEPSDSVLGDRKSDARFAVPVAGLPPL